MVVAVAPLVRARCMFGRVRASPGVSFSDLRQRSSVCGQLVSLAQLLAADPQRWAPGRVSDSHPVLPRVSFLVNDVVSAALVSDLSGPLLFPFFPNVLRIIAIYFVGKIQ